MVAVPGEVDNPNVLSIFVCDLDLTGVTLGDDLANQPRSRLIVVIRFDLDPRLFVRIERLLLGW